MAGNDSRPPMITARSALIILFAVLTGIGAGVLMDQAVHAPAQAVLVGVTAFAAAMKFFDWLIH